MASAGEAKKVKMGRFRPNMDFTRVNSTQLMKRSGPKTQAKNVLGISSNMRIEEIMPDDLHSKFVSQLNKV